RASLTSSSLNGLIMASNFFIRRVSLFGGFAGGKIRIGFDMAKYRWQSKDEGGGVGWIGGFLRGFA
ncbi:MAG: hypothetical protein K8953_07270, partial [Proteobacteria bacterium]|nr:hypothetical protein [Pseudomonadota bacterium]